MPTIFPGMDPYLESPSVWHGFHTGFIVYLRDLLQPALQPRYIAAVEERVYIEGPQKQAFIPDVLVRGKKKTRPTAGTSTSLLEPDSPLTVEVSALKIHERFIEILDREFNQRVVTVIEVLSPANKWPGKGRKSYRTKQKEVLSSKANLVEIDLLRTGRHSVAVPEWMARSQGPYHYLVCVNRAVRLREKFDLYLGRLQDRLPRITVPLAKKDPGVVLDLQAVLTQTYEAGIYRDLLRYDKPCRPPLTPEEQAWADELIAVAKVRPSKKGEAPAG